MYVVMMRDESGAWFATGHHNGCVTGWADHIQFDTPYSVVIFYRRELAEAVAMRTTLRNGIACFENGYRGPCHVRPLSA